MLDAERALARAGAQPASSRPRPRRDRRRRATWSASTGSSCRARPRGREPGRAARPRAARSASETTRAVRAPRRHQPGHRRHAAMLVARHALALVARGPRPGRGRLRGARRVHRSTPMAARTLLQQAVPTTFGLEAAGWLVGVLDARKRIAGRPVTASRRSSVALPGRSPRSAATGPRCWGSSHELDLAVPTSPGTRTAARRGARRGARDRRRRVRKDRSRPRPARPDGGGRGARGTGGGSSTMPHKRNPVGATLARACARLAAVTPRVLIRSDRARARACSRSVARRVGGAVRGAFLRGWCRCCRGRGAGRAGGRHGAGCARTSTRPVAWCWPSASRSRLPSAWDAARPTSWSPRPRRVTRFATGCSATSASR